MGLGTIAIVAFLGIGSSEAQSSTVLNDLMKAVDAIRAVADSPNPEPERLAQAMRVGCNAISRLMEDPTFQPALKTAFDKGDVKAAEAVRHDLALFATEFARWEQDQLRKAGATAESTAMLMALLGSFRQVQLPREFSAAVIHTKIKNLGDELCQIAKQIEDKKTKDLDRKTRQQWYCKIAGIAIVAVDAFAIPNPTTAPLALVSMALGTIVADGLPGNQ